MSVSLHTSVALFYRTVPISPETAGRVSEVRIQFSAPVKKGDVIFKLDSSKQEAAMETARRKIAEVDAASSTATLLSVRQCCTVRRRGMSGNKRK